MGWRERRGPGPGLAEAEASAPKEEGEDREGGRLKLSRVAPGCICSGGRLEEEAEGIGGEGSPRTALGTGEEEPGGKTVAGAVSRDGGGPGGSSSPPGYTRGPI